jgi:cytochrome P450
VEKKDFNAGFWRLFHDLSKMNGLVNQFAWIQPMMRSLPPWVHQAMGMEYIMTWENVCSPPRPSLHANVEQKSKKQIREIMANSNLQKKEAPMIFREVLNSDLPPEEKSIDRLWQEGQLFNIAGAETTAWTLGLVTYYLLAQPQILRRLRQELASVVKNGRIDTSTADLEQLPYLVSCFWNSRNDADGADRCD